MGEAPGHWQRFDVARHCPPHADPVERLRQHPRCALLHLPASPALSSGKSPPEYHKGGLADLSWECCGCAVQHYTTRAAHLCLVRKNITRIHTSGDSVMGGFGRGLQWHLNVSDSGGGWYEPGGKRVAKRATVRIELGGGRAHTVQFQGHAGGDLEVDPVREGAAVIDRLHLDKAAAAGEGALFVTNLGVHHWLWRHSLHPWVDAVVKGLAHGMRRRLEQLREHRVLGRKGPAVELVYLSPSAVHGFREPYVTLPRSREARRLLAGHLKGAGFRVLDSWATEVARPEMAPDGLHYNDATNYMHVQLLLNMVCNER